MVTGQSNSAFSQKEDYVHIIETATLISLGGLALAAATFFIGRLSAAKSIGQGDGEMKADIKHIKATQAELKEDIRSYGINYTEVRTELESIKGRVAKLEELIRIYHRRSGASLGEAAEGDTI